jgi:hypothetical protein
MLTMHATCVRRSNRSASQIGKRNMKRAGPCCTRIGGVSKASNEPGGLAKRRARNAGLTTKMAVRRPIDLNQVQTGRDRAEWVSNAQPARLSSNREKS